jgi:hypothetical protein
LNESTTTVWVPAGTLLSTITELTPMGPAAPRRNASFVIAGECAAPRHSLEGGVAKHRAAVGKMRAGVRKNRAAVVRIDPPGPAEESAFETADNVTKLT